MKFVEIVNGMKYVPESLRVAIFTSEAEKLYKVCQEANNFYKEEEAARELKALGKDIPSNSIYLYTKATTLSYIGNTYGYSFGAHNPVFEMITYWPTLCVEALFKIIDEDLVIIGQLISINPAKRFKEILEIIKGKVLSSKVQRNLICIVKCLSKK